MTRTEVESLIEQKLAPAIAVVERVDSLMARVHTLLECIEKAFGDGGAAVAKEQFDKLPALLATLEKAAAAKASQHEELKRLLVEFHRLTAEMHEGRKS